MFQQGLAALRENRYSSAEISFRQGLTISPDNWLAHKYLGDTLRKLGRPDYDVIREYEISAKLAESPAAAAVPKAIIAEIRDQSERQYNQERNKARADYEEQQIAKDKNDLAIEQRVASDRQKDFRDAITLSEENIRFNGNRIIRPAGSSIPLTTSLECPATNKGIFDKTRHLPDGSVGRVRARIVDSVVDKMIVEHGTGISPLKSIFVGDRGNLKSDDDWQVFSIISKNVTDLINFACKSSVETAESFQEAVRSNAAIANSN
ncbi:tetratricopeptide repeat protein [Methylobacterium radiotolerans]